ncbi:MAG: hypothetical protein IT395_04515, partial [Candidatus Omnitrophica bacterium]|nr:hypothetical protein [Candidatus Omnitrophota bacterium]
MKNVRVLLLSVFVATAVLAVTAPYAHATLDLTTVGSSGFINDAYFTTTGVQSTGSGVINSFVRLQTNDNVEEGYNTSGRALLFDENNSPVFTKDLLLSEVPVVSLLNQSNQTTAYRQFLLDINQQNCGQNKPDCTSKFLSLDSLNIYLGSAGGLLQANPDDLGTSVFKLTADNIKLNYDLNPGSGGGDMFAYIPDAFFTGTNQYVYLYSKFGEEYPNTAGFE